MRNHHYNLVTPTHILYTFPTRKEARERLEMMDKNRVSIRQEACDGDECEYCQVRHSINNLLANI